MTYAQRETLIFQTAVQIAPAFRDKFEFNRENAALSHYDGGNDYDSLADMAYLAAEALVKKHEAKVIAAEAKDAEERKKTK